MAQLCSIHSIAVVLQTQQSKTFDAGSHIKISGWFLCFCCVAASDSAVPRLIYRSWGAKKMDKNMCLMKFSYNFIGEWTEKMRHSILLLLIESIRQSTKHAHTIAHVHTAFGVSIQPAFRRLTFAFYGLLLPHFDKICGTVVGTSSIFHMNSFSDLFFLLLF